MEKDISNITIGIRFSKKFKILDEWGGYFDTVLNNENKYLNTDYFTKVGLDNPNEKVLYNPETQNHLKISPSDVIFSHNIDNLNFKKEFEWIKQAFKNDVQEKLFRNTSINNFLRVGVVYTQTFDGVEVNKKFITKLLKSDDFDLTSIRFSKRTPVGEANLKKEINDYINIITSSTIDENDKSSISYDYQQIFDPMIEDFRQANFDKIVKDSFNYLKKEIFSKLKDVTHE